MVSTKSASIPVTEPPLATLDRQRIPDWQLWLVGDGVEHAPLRALSEEVGIAEQVHFFGDVPYEQVSPMWGLCFSIRRGHYPAIQ
jgi:hypothetical protein